MHSSTAMILLNRNFFHQVAMVFRRLMPFVLVFNLACGQTNPKAVKLFKDGQDLMNKKKTYQAVKSFESAIALDPGYRDAYLELYQFYFNQGNMIKAMETLQRATHAVTIGKPSILFSLGQLELNHGMYAQASVHFTDYLALNTKDTLTRLKARSYLAKTTFSLANLQDSSSIQFAPLNASINTPAPEYLPSLDAAGTTLVFTRRTNNQEDLMISRWNAGIWSPPLSWPKNSPKNEGAHVISADGKTIVFTGCDWEDSYGGCDLYISEFIRDKWSNPRNIGTAINSRSWESQPSLSANGRILFFVSDRPGGSGGYDIWKSNKLLSGWSKPVNAGPGINTSGDEFSPCLHADGVTLYFRSEGKPGFGSQDLFFSQKTNKGTWAEAVNLGFPLNDHRDQGAMVVALDGYTAFYTLQLINQFNQIITSDLVTFQLPAKARANACRYIKGA
ncbi:MAG: tetratricopeptide repeat protein, partial [Saprospiraceae bacterium]|nr:tetratricopeptide repeat protein [Saprospiraceae bacterium]